MFLKPNYKTLVTKLLLGPRVPRVTVKKQLLFIPLPSLSCAYSNYHTYKLTAYHIFFNEKDFHLTCHARGEGAIWRRHREKCCHCTTPRSKARPCRSLLPPPPAAMYVDRGGAQAAAVAALLL